MPYDCLIEARELHKLLQSAKNLKILDASFVLPSSPIDPKTEFKESHIQGAQFFDIDEISDRNSDLPHMLPSAEDFEQAVSTLGISNTDQIVIYGQDGIVMGPARAWWMFRAFGHDNVCVLNGGLPAWTNEGYDTTNMLNASYIGQFKACKKDHLLCDMNHIQNKIGKACIMDARPSSRFNGDDPEPRAGLKSGHIPTSINIPAASLVNDHQKLKNREELEAVFAPYSIDKKTPLIATCGSGVTACMIAFALYNIGIKNVRIYDGSWAEWGLN